MEGAATTLGRESFLQLTSSSVSQQHLRGRGGSVNIGRPLTSATSPFPPPHVVFLRRLAARLNWRASRVGIHPNDAWR